MSQSPPTPTLIDIIVLCCSKSELKSLVGTDALRSVLEGTQRALFPEPDTLTLQPLYELLEGQPGFNPEQAVAPLCRIKGWETRMQIRVELPVKLQILDQSTREKWALRCTASDADLEKLLKPATPNTPVPFARVIESGTMRAGDTGANPRRFKIALAAALLGVVAAGVSIYLTFHRGSTAVSLSGGDISDKIPLRDVRRSGPVILATVADPLWLKKPEEERRAQLEAAAGKVRAQSAVKLVLTNEKGVPIGTLSVRNDPVVTFTQ